jgi:hypothetical protein
LDLPIISFVRNSHITTVIIATHKLALGTTTVSGSHWDTETSLRGVEASLPPSTDLLTWMELWEPIGVTSVDTLEGRLHRNNLWDKYARGSVGKVDTGVN